MIKAVLFDFGGVLTESGKTGFIGKTIADLYGVNPADLNIESMHFALRRGQGNEDDFFEELNQKYGKQITKEMFVQSAHATFVPSEEVYKLATTLREHGIKTGILSNIFNMNAKELRKQGWYDGFDPVILSCEEGYAKPEEPFYKAAIQKLGVQPNEILFIDDQQKCMPPAQKLGIQTITAVSPQQIVDDTKRLISKLNYIDL